jgi:hypothetical protein
VHEKLKLKLIIRYYMIPLNGNNAINIMLLMAIFGIPDNYNLILNFTFEGKNRK